MSEQPCAPTLRRMWAEGAEGRQSWALNAYSRFRSSLSPWTNQSLPEAQDETVIILFGPTQVGKTTLLLELLGVAREYLPHVSEVLRGGRGLGRSATATPMIYSESLGELWQLDGHEAGLNDEGLRQALAQIRDGVEAGAANTRLRTVHIPVRYFDTERGAAPRVRILDLPGADPADGNEAEHVRRVAQEYAPLADLIMLITRADDLGFLKPWNLTEQLGRTLDWTLAPERFCIVTSYAFTLGTLRDWLSEPGETRDVPALRARTAEQIRRFDGMNVAVLPPLYPLDFGKSWADTPVERRAVVEPLLVELRRDLRQRIAESAQPLGRLRQARDAYQVALKVQERIRRNHAQAQEENKRVVQQRAGQLESWDRQSERRRERLRMLSDAATVDRACRNLQHEINKVLDGIPRQIPGNEVTKKRLLAIQKDFQSELQTLVFSLETLVAESDEAGEVLKHVMENFDRIEFSTHLATFFEEFFREIEGYWFNGAFHNFEEDWKRLLDSMEKAHWSTQTRLSQACSIAAQALKATFSDQRKRMVRGLQSVETRMKRIAAEHVAQQAKMVKLAEETAGIERKLEEDKAHATQFNGLLRAALFDDLRKRGEALAKEPIPARRFIRLLEAVSVCARARDVLDPSPTGTMEVS